MATITITVTDVTTNDGQEAAEVRAEFDPPFGGGEESKAQELSRHVMEFIIEHTGRGAYALEHGDGHVSSGTVEHGRTHEL